MFFINKLALSRKELPNVQVSDTTDDDSIKNAGKQIMDKICNPNF